MRLDEQSYRLLIERLARERAGETVLNGSFSHASVINECMFASANQSVDLVTCNFSEKIFGTDAFVVAFNRAATEGVKVRILFENKDPRELSDHPIFDHLKTHPNIEMRVLPKEISDELECNYTIMDKTSYRFERDKAEPMAVATFGDVEGFSDDLCLHFGSIWTHGKKVTLN